MRYPQRRFVEGNMVRAFRQRSRSISSEFRFTSRSFSVEEAWIRP